MSAIVSGIRSASGLLSLPDTANNIVCGALQHMGLMLANHNCILFICVIYRTNPDTSSTLDSILKIRMQLKHHRLVIWNNGALYNLDDSHEIFSRLKSVFLTVEVVNDINNTSLAKIYNAVYDRYRDLADALCILDDDTILPINYAEVYIRNYQTNLTKRQGKPIMLYLPIVYHGNIMVSPAEANGERYPSIRPGVIQATCVRAIASGMIIPTITFARYRFDERFMFYGADTEYLLRMARDKQMVCVMNVNVLHSLSTESMRRAPYTDFKYMSLLQSFVINGALYNMRLLSIYKIARLSLRQTIYSKQLSPLYQGLRHCLIAAIWRDQNPPGFRG